ncbi:MAG TPA: ABC transporter substrate-binding protein [candidate division Zixibacteria bacterium]|nr:ABC transporter substrate-binding protein [candidate division Zixibacteria bacterium]
MSRAGLCAILLPLLLLALSAAAMPQDRIRIGLSSVSATNGSVWIAEEKGFFRKHGADVEVIVIGGGGARVVSSLVAGDIQFSVGGGEGSIRSQLRGADTVIVASSMNRGLQRILARPEIKSYQDLRGKRVGITQFGSAGHLALVLMLRKWNLRPDQVQILQVGSSPAMLASLDKGGIDAAVLTLPTFFLAEEKGYRVIGDPAVMDIFYLQNTLESTRTFVRRNRAQALRFMKGYIEGIAYFKKHKAESIQVLRKKLRIQSEQERDNRYLELSYNLLASTFYNDVPYPSLKGVQTILDKMAEEDPKSIKDRTAQSFVDDSLVRELDDAGFIKALQAH